METKIVFIYLMCILMSAMTKTTRSRPRKKLPKSHFITNWKQYKLPDEIETLKLKAILENLAKFNRLEYCPLRSYKDCEKTSVEKVVTQIVSNQVNEKAKLNSNSNSNPVVANNGDDSSKDTANDSINNKTKALRSEHDKTEDKSNLNETVIAVEANHTSSNHTNKYRESKKDTNDKKHILQKLLEQEPLAVDDLNILFF